MPSLFAAVPALVPCRQRPLPAPLDVGAAATVSSTAAYRDKHSDDGSCIDGCGSDNDDVISLLVNLRYSEY